MLLSLIIFLPLAMACVLPLFRSPSATRTFTLIVTIIEFAVSLMLLHFFDPFSAQVQLVEKYAWVPALGINYFVGVDGISLWLVLLTTFLTPLTILVSWKGIDQKIKSFHACILILETAMIGTFFSFDGVLFYMFWELMLVPMYLLVGVWGGERRIYAAVKFFIYTMVGSVFMLVALIVLMYMTKVQMGTVSASILDFYRLTIPFSDHNFFNPQTLMFFAFSLAFAIKVPLFPLHTWLPDAHVQAPTPGSVILAGVLLKMGTYGFLRFAIPLFPQAAEQFAPLFIILGVVGIIYGALVAMVQPDMKKLVAYSSVSHLGYVIAGLFAFNIEGVTGGLYQMLNHGVSTGGLFLLVGMIYERTHSREIAKYGGLAKALPVFAIFFFLITISSIAVPGTNGFVGEFLILLGVFKAHSTIGIFAVTGVIWGAVYMLWMYKKVFFGKAGPLVPEIKDAHHGGGDHHSADHHGVAHGAASAPAAAHDDHHHRKLTDLSWREIAVMVPLVIVVFWMGVFPQTFLGQSKIALDYWVQNRQHYHLSVQNNQIKPLGQTAKN